MKEVKKMRLLIMLMVATIFSVEAIAASLTGKVLDSRSKEPIIGATVIIDGTTQGGVTDVDGKFIIAGLKGGGKVTLNVAFVGYDPLTFDYGVKSEGSTPLSAPIYLKPSALLLDQVQVMGSAPTAVQMGDTVQYNAGAYKTHPDATAEDLLAKMPGFEVENGKVQSDGEDVKAVYVDGRAFFKNDVETAINSLPADAIESIQLFDEASDRSKFTGADDGNRTKTINIVTRAKSKNMQMGDFSLGYGSDDHFSGRANVNIFTDKHRFTVGFGANNINQPATAGGSGRFYGREGVNGLEKAYGARLNYSGKYEIDETHSTELDINYVFSKNETDKNSQERQLSNVSDYGYEVSSRSETNNQSHSLSVDLESDLGEKNKIIFRPKASISRTDSWKIDNSLRYSGGINTNEASTITTQTKDSYNVSGNFTWMHKFNEKNSIVVGASGSLSESNKDQLLVGNSTVYNAAIDDMVDSLINQNDLVYDNNNRIGGSFDYVYRLDEHQNISLEYEMKYNWGDSDSKTYFLDSSTGLYSDISEELSNCFDQNYLTQNAGMGYSLNTKNRSKLSVRASYETSSMQNEQIYPSYKSNAPVFNSVSGNMRLELPFGATKRLMVQVSAKPNLPSISQLQDVLDVSNPLKVSKGNPNLDQSYNTNFLATFSSNNIKKSTSIRSFLMFNNSANAMINSLSILERDSIINGVNVQKGAQYTTKVNAGSTLMAMGGAMFSFPLNFIKSKMTIGMRNRYTTTPTMFENSLSYINTNLVGSRMMIISNITPNIDFTVGNSISYTTSNSKNNNNNLNSSTYVKANWILFKRLVINSDYTFTYNYYSTPIPGQNPQFHLLNAGVGVKFLDNNAELRLSGYDLLNQNVSYTQTTDDQFTTNQTSQILQRYAMLSFSYKFNSMKNGYKPQQDEDGSRFGGAVGGGPRGPMGGWWRSYERS